MKNNPLKQRPAGQRVLLWITRPFVCMIKKHQRIQMRHIMRGYRTLKCSGHLDRIDVVKQALTEHLLSLTSKDFSPVVMGHGAESGEIIMRQYLLVHVGGRNLNRALLLAIGKKRGSVIYYLPKEWRAILSQHGFKVAHLRSAMLWQLYVCAFLLYGMMKIGKIVLAAITPWKSTDTKAKCYHYFNNLRPDNLPKNIKGMKSFDVISWYLQWSGKTAGIEAVHHSVPNVLPDVLEEIPILSSREPLPDLSGTFAVANYILFGMRACLIAASDCLRGRWWHALLLNQAALAAQVRTLPADSLAREYLFHNSDYIYRPLWTYEAEYQGSAITFYFYSTNCEGFKRSDDYQSLNYGWRAMNWPHYLVWDEYQADFVHRAVGEHVKIDIVGPVWFTAGIEKIPEVPLKSIAVFDVTPARDYDSNISANSFGYYTPEMAINFLLDIHNLTSIFNVALVWKQKRKIGRSAHPMYRRFIEVCEKKTNFVASQPETSPHQLIEACTATISMPFTSTALIAKEMGKPSIYYDPSGRVRKDNQATHGIEIVSGPGELSDWLSSVFKRSITENAL
jgi:polysaccharide biosynthesis PFTS motif protein